MEGYSGLSPLQCQKQYIGKLKCGAVTVVNIAITNANPSKETSNVKRYIAGCRL